MSSITTLLNMDYKNVCQFLKNKYGPIAKSYFTDETMITKSRGITRGKEGLYIHHIDEDKAIKLSTPFWAQKAPFAYQQPSRLVYCNLLEHLVLHIKIFELVVAGTKTMPNEVGSGGIYAYLVPELNDIYSGITYQQPWKQKVIAQVLPFEQDYLQCIKKLVTLNFPYRLLTSFNAQFGTWDNNNNASLYQKLINIGVFY